MDNNKEDPSSIISGLWTDLLMDDHNPDLEPESVYRDRIMLKFKDKIDLEGEQFRKGYKVILNGLKDMGEDLTKYEITEDRIKVLDDKKAALEQLNEGKTYQDLLNYDDGSIIKMYEVARARYSEKNYEDAICALKFITGISPLISTFWTVLANALKRNNQLEEASLAYEVPVLLDPTNFKHYLQAAECMIALDQSHDRASQMLESAKEFAQQEQLPELEEQLNEAIQNIQQIATI